MTGQCATMTSLKISGSDLSLYYRQKVLLEEGNLLVTSEGRSRGGFTSKIHAVVDALGNLIAFTVTAGQYSEYPQASNLLIQHHNTTIPADKVYDSRSLIDALHQQGCEAVIPSRRTNHHPRTVARHLYKERHLIETFFNKIRE